jgi:uncharacterized protein (DUF433 family)
MPPGFSLKEAAAIVGVPEPAVRKAIESGLIRPRVVSAGRAPRYRFGVRDMLYLKLVAGFPLALGREDKVALGRVLAGGGRPSAAVDMWQAREGDLVARAGDLVVRVEVGPVRRALARDLLAYRRGRGRIVSDPAVLGGEPVFEGTRVPLAHVAALIARGVPLEEVAEDYPALGRDDLAFAAIHGRMKRDPGRPRRPLTLTRDGRPVPPDAIGARDGREAAHR